MKTWMLFPKIWNKAEYQLSLFLFNIILEGLASLINQEKEIKGIQFGKEEIKFSLSHNMIAYVENPKDYLKKKNTRTNWFLAGYRIQDQKTKTNHISKAGEHMKTEIKSTMSYTITPKMKYLHINLKKKKHV